MLTKWGLTNFKSVYNADLNLAPLTVLTGANSSGKSSFIQSMLMIAQTLQNKSLDRALILNGLLVDLGRFDHIMSFHPNNENKNSRKNVPIGIRWVYEFEQEAENKINPWGFLPMTATTTVAAATLAPLAIPLAPLVVPFVALATPLVAMRKVLKSRSSAKQSLKPRSSAKKIHFEIEFDAYHKTETTLSGDESMYRKEQMSPHIHSITELIEGNRRIEINMQENDTPEGKTRSGFTKTGTNESPKNFAGLKLFHFIPEIIFYPETAVPPEEGANSKNENSTAKLSDDSIVNEKELRESLDATETCFSRKFRYLGPLRYRGSTYSISKAGDSKDVGINGEYTAAVLDAYYEEEISFIPSECFSNDSFIKAKPVNMPLDKALTDWLVYLGVADEIKPELTEHGYELKSLLNLENGNDFAVNLSHVGTGVSQVLPILVLCLLAEPNSILVFEQPELHLYPRVQSRLVDFFLSMALLGKQCIIENHSEHFIDKLRLRIAQAPGDSLVDKVAVYFAEKKDGKSEFRRIHIDEYSVIEDWPHGFFDESLKTASDILFAAFQKENELSGETDD